MHANRSSQRTRLSRRHHRPARLSRTRLAVVGLIVLAFGAIGVYFLASSRAATPAGSLPRAASGDLNGDGKVNVQDLALLLINFGKSGSNLKGDLNGDGKVTVQDLALLLVAFGQGGGGGGGSAKYPADVLNLTNWKITLPIAGSSSTSPLEILQPQLATYTIDPWFHLNTAKDGVVFHVNHGGVSTSNSSNPRSELREMANGGKDQASWSSTSGTNTMTIKQKVTHLTDVKPQVVVGQIHNSSDDITVFRMEGNGGSSASLYITDGNTTHAYKITDSYTLGTVFTVKFEVAGGTIKYYYNDQLLPYSQNKSGSGWYFKAGNYLQSNPSTAPSESTSAYSEVEIDDLQVTHN